MRLTEEQHKELVESATASVRYLPVHSGDGYDYGGGAILCVGRYAFPVGESLEAQAIAEEMAGRWNSARALSSGRRALAADSGEE